MGVLAPWTLPDLEKLKGFRPSNCTEMQVLALSITGQMLYRLHFPQRGEANMQLENLFEDIPQDLPQEQLRQLLRGGSFSLERIVSRGHSSAEDEWYDQHSSEWVILLKGAAELVFGDGRSVRLRPGDFLTIAAHERHRVAWTDPLQDSVWLAVHFDAESDQATKL